MKQFLLYFLIMLSLTSFAQRDYPAMKAYEDSIKNCFRTIKQAKSDSAKKVHNERIIALFKRILHTKESFQYPFDSLLNMGRFHAPDKAFRIYNWNLQYDDGTFEYFGFLQMPSGESKSFIYYELKDQSATIDNPEDHTGDHNDWFGALYYQIVLAKDRRNKYYTLLGWDGNNDYSNKKIVDVLYFSRSGKPRFGKSIFKVGKFKKKRLVFEYSYLASMALRFNEKLNMIVYDHLAPSNPNLKGQYQYYGPDFSYDGLYFKNGKWNEEIDIDVRNPKTKTIRKKNISYTF